MVERYTSLRPLALIVAIMASIWGLFYIAWPVWALLGFTVCAGIGSSFVLGIWIKEAIERRLEEAGEGEKLAREAIQREFDDAGRG